MIDSDPISRRYRLEVHCDLLDTLDHLQIDHLEVDETRMFVVYSRAVLEVTTVEGTLRDALVLEIALIADSETGTDNNGGTIASFVDELETTPDLDIRPY